jgi:phosphoribosylamine-glycine ligase
VEETRAWLDRVDYAEGIFPQEYLGRAEAGHIALVSGGDIHSLVTNQEYKRAHAGNLGIVCGAPLGGLVEKDPDDKYGFARQLLYPLRPWLNKVNYHGPIQVTACRHEDQWQVVEYNIRLGITSGAMILRLLEDPVHTLWATARNQKLAPTFRKDVSFGCSMTLAGYGYPHLRVRGPKLPVSCTEPFDCDVWWNEVEGSPEGNLMAVGHRIAEVVALGKTRKDAVRQVHRNIRRIRCLGAFYRTDIGETLWPPGNEN